MALLTFHVGYRKIRCNCCLTTGVLLTLLGSLLLVWTPYEIMSKERTEMRPGFPAFDWWVDTPDSILLKAFVFNYTNSEAFMNGDVDKLVVEEIGPIVYREKLEHLNVSRNANGTMSFVSRRSVIFMPEKNDIDMNATIIVPNYAVLGMVSFLHDASFLTKMAVNLLLRSVGSPAFINTTVYNFLWNFSDPILEAGQRIVPDLVPSTNIGMLETVYRDFTDGCNVYIGTRQGDERFFLIEKYNGSPYLFPEDETCSDEVAGSTEGTLYPQSNTKKTVLKYWRKTMCRVVSLYYNRTFDHLYNVESYKYKLQPDAFNRRDNLSTDCYKGTPVLLSGLSDVSMCYNNIPMAASFPHFLYGNEELQGRVSGLEPNETKHESYVIVEPMTGIPLESFARSQSNLIVRKLNRVHPTFAKFSDSILPMFWLEYSQEFLPQYVADLMYFSVVVVPNCQYYFVSLLIVIGCVILALSLKKLVIKTRKYKEANITDARRRQDIQLAEREKFLKC